MTLNVNKIHLPKSVTKFRDKFKIRCIVKREPCCFNPVKARIHMVYFGFQ